MRDWWLKIQSAKKHMVDIQEAARAYASSQPYSFIRINLPDATNQIGYTFRIIKQPDPMIAVMLGDFIHNLRSALDYVAVACAPRKYRYETAFPIVRQDIFAKDESGEFVVKDSKIRKDFESKIQWINTEAKALILRLQPYQFGNLAPRIVLGIISRLENADKHRELITIGCGGRDFIASFIIPDLPEPIPYHQSLAVGSDFLKHDTPIVFNLPSNVIGTNGTPLLLSEVDMHFAGTAKILVKVSGIEENQMLLDSILNTAFFDVSDTVKLLEQYVLKGS
ncbi:hypothetical protein ABFB09_09580 [Dehalogenimonas sp. THU2]|uniref:hypothetical protein n=1 Tax=Dehalogenimonas sp. THU2 TaxID=3151121 RepID=UPI003218590B